MVLFLLGFYIYGDSKIIQDMSNSSLQISNSQIYHLLFSNEKLLNEVSRSENPSITIFYPSNATNIYEWTQTLKFYGFDNIQMIEDPLLDKNPNLIFQAQYKQMIINLHSLDEDEYLNSNNVKYTYRHAYYDYQVVMEK